MKYLPELDGMRCVAVLAVLLFHLDLPFVSGGFLGVDMFFVLSGYLITRKVLQSIASNSFSLQSFYIARFWRLYPALVTTTGLTFFIGALFLTDRDLKKLAFSAMTSLASISNFQFWKESGYFDTEAARKPLLHTWSLAVEEQFYIFWPPILLAMSSPRSTKQRLQPAFVLALLLGSLLGSEMVLQSHRPASTAFFLFPFRANEFLFGAILNWTPRPKSRLVNISLSTASFLSLICLFLLYDGARHFPGLGALLPCAATSLLIQCTPNTPVASLLSSPFALFVGRISYSLYLTHWPVIITYKYISGHEVINTFDILFLIGASFTSAFLLHYHVESRFYSRPTHTKLGTNIHYSQRRLVPLRTLFFPVFLSIALSSIFFQCYWTHGWSWRSRALKPIMDCNCTGPPKLPFSPTELEDHIDSYHKSKRHRIYDRYGPITGSDSPSATRMLFLGDSLAHQFLPLAHYYGMKYNIQFHIWWYGACPGLYQVSAVYNERDFGPDTSSHELECHQRQIKWFKDLPPHNFSAVFLASRWHKFVEPPNYVSVAPIPQMYLLPLSSNGKNRVMSLALSRSLFPRALSNTVSFLEKAGVKPILISQAPHPGINPAHCLTRPAWFNHDVNSQPWWCVRATQKQAMDRAQFTADAMKRVRGTFNAEVLLLENLLCKEGGYQEKFCTVVWCENVLYRNADHLSDFGALYVAMKWETRFQQLLETFQSIDDPSSGNVSGRHLVGTSE